jgi:two-component sensor histidine kinase
MAVLQNKQRWKVVLLLLAAAIAGITLWYTNSIARRIRDEEKAKVELWHIAIRKKEELVKLTQVLFDSLRSEETRKAEFLGRAYKILSLGEGNYEFPADVITQNKTIPLLVFNTKYKQYAHNNIDTAIKKDPVRLEELRLQFAKEYPPIPFPDANIIVYYSNSYMYKELRQTIDDLVSSFFNETVINTASVPVIVTDSTKTHVVQVGKIDTLKCNVNQVLAEMKEGYEPIEIKIPGRATQYIFYDDSSTIQQLKLFPYLQLSLIGVFLVVAYVMFSTFRRSEQNLVWVGMAKETAHQLGTPLSALMAWRDLFEQQGVSKALIDEFNKDIERLSTITERFSKIGSEAALTPVGAKDLVEEILDYLRVRISSEVNIEVKSDGNPQVNVNVALFSWVIENLVKNSVDAMDAKGQLTVSIHEANGKVYIDVKDSGKGIPKRKWKTIFEPGYTTKLRGWGLGLSLAKRIVKNYHKGSIYVLSSSPAEGSVIRIALKK